MLHAPSSHSGDPNPLAHSRVDQKDKQQLQTNDGDLLHELNVVFHSSMFDQGIIFTPFPQHQQSPGLSQARFHLPVSTVHPSLDQSTQRISKLTQPDDQLSLLLKCTVPRVRSIVNASFLTKHSKSFYTQRRRFNKRVPRNTLLFPP
jgi:hypothetical protein